MKSKLLKLLFFLVFLCPVLTQAQIEDNPKLEKLNKEIYGPNSHDTTKVRALMDLASELYIYNIDTVIHISQQIQEICSKRLETETDSEVKRLLHISLSGSYNNLGYVYFQKGDNDLALQNYFEALAMQQITLDTAGYALCLNNIAQVYEAQGKIQMALDFLQTTRMIQEIANLKKDLAITLNNIGLIYKRQQQYVEAEEYYIQSLELRREMGDMRGVGGCYNNLGSLLKVQDKDEEALAYYFKSLAIRDSLQDYLGTAYSYNNIGGMYLEMGNDSLAEYYLNMALEIRTEFEHKSGIAETLTTLAELNLRNGKLDLALYQAQKAKLIANEIGYPSRIFYAARVLSEIYEEKGLMGEALSQYKQFISMRDSINNSELSQATVEQTAKYNYEKQKIKDDLEHENELLLEKESKQKQRILTWAIGFGLVLVLGFLVFVFNRLRVTKKQRNEIKLQKEEIQITHSRLEEKNQEVLDSIIYAKRIQKAIIPSFDFIKEHLPNSFVFYEPKDVVAGDFYWMQALENEILIAAADCTGHGVPGAMVSVVCNNALNRAVREYGLRQPDQLLNKVRELVIAEFEQSDEELKDGMDIALVSLAVSSKSIESRDKESLGQNSCSSLKFSGANNPLWLIRNGELIEYKANKQPIGVYHDDKPFSLHEVDLQEGDTFYIFSDGFADQFGGEKGKKYKSERFKQFLQSIVDRPISEQRTLLKTEFESWKGDLDQLDDICIVGVKV